MDAKKITIIIIILFFFSLFGIYMYYYNEKKMIEAQKYEQMINELKNEQAKEDNIFNSEIDKNKKLIEKTDRELQNKDSDGDGLTYSQELELGTSDDNQDSDADGIIDPLDLHPKGGGNLYKKTIYWTHEGLTYSTQFSIAEDKYYYYQNLDRGSCCEGWEDFATPDDPTIQTIAKDIGDVSLTTGDSKAVLAIDFVESMLYQYDIDYNDNGEWPKYAIETIIDERGDCEDTSFLMASILEALNYDVVLVKLPGHMAVAIRCSDCSGSYYTYNGGKYYYLETTNSADAWEIGWIPEEHKGIEAELIDV